MHSVYKQSHPPTGVEHTIHCNFLSPEEKNLVVAGSNFLRIYRLIEDDVKTSASKAKLEFVASYPLFGNVMSMASVTLPTFPKDLLLLSFKDAKVSVVEYDMAADTIKTLSLHHFEDEDIKGGWTSKTPPPIVRVDPESRCAAMIVYGRKLVVLPFRKDSLITDIDRKFTKMNQGFNSPILASYVIHLNEMEEKLDNVIDIQFLHGYYEPTLLVLCEPVKTFSGRLAVRSDTCAIAGLSLNLQERVHPVIWSLTGLPFDCSQVLAIPKPIGGCLVVATNSVIYLNQSMPPYGVSVNSIADTTTNFPLHKQEGVKMTLDCCQAAFLSADQILFSLRGGDIYVLTLIADSMRCVRSFHFDKAAASVLTTCVCLCDKGFVFLGSRLGNSLLLSYSAKDKTDGDVKNLPAEVPAKKLKLDSQDWLLNGNDADLDLETEVYGMDDATASKAITYQFEVCDSLLNIGPCGNITVGEPVHLSEEFIDPNEPDLELVTTSGYGKNGAICVLQRSVRPQIATTFEIPGVKRIFTVHSAKLKSEVEGLETHTYLLLAREESTMILQTGQEINELENSGFITAVPTIFAGNLGGNKYIVQVNSVAVRLLEGHEERQHISLEKQGSCVSASLQDPYLAVLTEEGAVLLYCLKEFRNEAKLTLLKTINTEPGIEAVCLYRDVSGIFTTRGNETETFTFAPPKVEIKPEFKPDVDDDDDILYGDKEMPVFEFSSTSDDQSSSKPSSKFSKLSEVKPTYWLFIILESGDMEIHSVPEGRLVFSVQGLQLANRLLVDATQVSAVNVENFHESTVPPTIKEFLVAGLGHLQRKPHLFVRLSNEELLIYQAFSFNENTGDEQLKIRFRKMPHNPMFKARKVGGKFVQDDEAEWKTLPRLRYFANIAGYSGVFVSGPYPHWLMMTARGELRCHPMSIDGAVVCFAPFHNVNCSKGFLYVNGKEELRICNLPTHLLYDAPWPVRKVPLRCTAHFIAYQCETRTYAIVTSSSEPSNRVYIFNGDDKELSVEERDDRFPYPCVEQFSLQIYSPINWEPVPNARIEFDEWEHVTCLKNVSLAYEGNVSGLRDYLAVSTNYNFGEDITSRGRIFLMDVIEVVPEPGQPLTNTKMKVIYDKDQRGPATALTHVQGFLVSALGQKVYLWQLKNNDLVGIAFIDTDIYVHSLVTINNFILAADAYKSVSVLWYQESYRTLSIVSKDPRFMEVMAAEYFVDNSQLGFLVTDADQNMLLYMYMPENRESLGGQRLIRKGDFHVGQGITTMFRVRCKLTEPWTGMRLPPVYEKRHLTMFATLDGALGYVMPIPEKTYRRLQMLQNVLTTSIPHTAGLNPKAYRTYRTNARLLSNPVRGIVDGELVWQFLNLSHSERLEVAKKIGTRIEDVMDDLIEIDHCAAYY